MTRAAGAIARQCTFITRLADDLLDAGRIGTGKMHLQLEAVDVRTAILEGIEMCRPKLADRHVELRMELPPSSIVVAGDRVRLIQMVANLLDNAAKYTPSGGHIRIGCTSRRGQAELWVSDTGQGIAADQLSRIFEPFTQGRESSADGLGLGLALVRELVQLHHGDIDVKSDGAGRGSRFAVRLPLSSPTS